MKTYIGIDNGVTGSIGVIRPNGYIHVFDTPVYKSQNYTKTKKNISRLHWYTFKQILEGEFAENTEILIVIERPLVNPGMFQATVSAVRCLEAQLICIEHFSLPFQYLDSKAWQKELLPAGVKGSTELKKASIDIGTRLFPLQQAYFQRHGDADGLLIAEYARRKGL